MSFLKISLVNILLHLLLVVSYSMQSEAKRYVIFGSVGAGKSTVVEMLSKKLGLKGYCELRHNWDAQLMQFLDSNYVEFNGTEEQKKIHKDNSNKSARIKYAFPLQKKILEVFNAFHPDKVKEGVFESAPLTIRWTFVESNITNNNFTKEQEIEYDKLDKELGWGASIYFYLNTPPQTCLERLEKRQHIGDSNYEINYLRDLDKVNRSCFKKLQEMEQNQKAEVKIKVYEISTPKTIEGLDATIQEIKLHIDNFEELNA